MSSAVFAGLAACSLLCVPTWDCDFYQSDSDRIACSLNMYYQFSQCLEHGPVNVTHGQCRLSDVLGHLTPSCSDTLAILLPNAC